MLKLKQRKIRTHSGETRRWYISGTCPYTKRRVRESTGTDSRDEAQHVLAAYLTRARDDATYGSANGTALFAEAVVEYFGKRGEARFLDPLLAEFGKYRLKDITDQMLTVAGDRIYPGAKASTLVRQLYGPMQAVWNAAVAAKMAPPRLFAKPKVKYATAVAVTDQWLLKLLHALPRLEQRAAILFMSFSGARSSEVVNVLVKHYDPVTGRVLIAHTKNDDPREVLLPPFVNEAMQLLPMDDPEARLFGYASRFSLNRIIKRGCARAGIPYFSPHKVGRHTFAARFLADGHSLKALQEAGGWRTIGVVAKTYGHLERSQVQNAVASVTTPIGTLLTQQEAATIVSYRDKRANS